MVVVNANRQIEVENDKIASEDNQTARVKSYSNVATDKSIADKKVASDLDAKITALDDRNNLT